MVDFAFLLQLYNSIFALVLGTESFLSQRSFSFAFAFSSGTKLSIAAWLLPNALWLLLTISGVKLDVPPFAHHPLTILSSRALQTAALAAMLALFILAGAMVVTMRCYEKDIGDLKAWGIAGCGVTIGLWVVLFFIDWHNIIEASFPMRMVFIVASYGAVCFWDARRRRPGLESRQFLVHFALATIQTAVLMPFLATALASLFLLLASACQFLGIGTEWLNYPIYYGVLYGPWAGVYVLVKRRCVTGESTGENKKNGLDTYLPT
uniref:Uncharacterized protein n=1 Tax=Lotharella oceanica TaxID=641309 RepID=A0A7S2TWI8_9EUKA|mmetsp:Transcript_33060/g.61444  ORF Transcript_33060/g.61444 Transcript_33060/m.61444 type:complete len:264 (+) Transcript_33060:64-855(+)